MAIIYDSLRVQNPFHNRAELAEWVRAHPGRFTIDVHFSGMTFLKSLLIDIAGGGNALQGPFDEEAYNRYATELWDYLNGIKKYFWKEGRTFPSGTAQMHQLFMNGEIDYTMSNNDGAVDNQVLQGVFPETSRAYVLDTGTIQNSHYLGIVHNAPHKAGAMVVINFLLSPEAQLKKMDPLVLGRWYRPGSGPASCSVAESIPFTSKQTICPFERNHSGQGPTRIGAGIHDPFV